MENFSGREYKNASPQVMRKVLQTEFQHTFLAVGTALQGEILIDTNK